MILYGKDCAYGVSAAGGKGAGLSKLKAYGLNVPDFFVIAAGTDIHDKNFAAELDGFAANLHCGLFAVRSSSVNEDGAENSFAGQYTTLLDVTRENLYDAVKSVAQSCGNQTVKAYSGRFAEEERGVAVVVQRQLHGEYSGVMFTTSPYDESERIIESVRGAGENLVSGIAAPDRMTVKKNGGENLNGFYKTLAEAGAMLEEKEGCPLDIEWTYADGELWFLQMRPLTAVGDQLPPIPDREWNMYVYRDFCLFAHGVQRIASYPEVQKRAFGFSVPIAEGLIVCGREFYSPENDAACDKIWKGLDRDGFFEKFIKNIKNSVRATRRRANALKNVDLTALSVNELFGLYRREIKAYIKSYVPLMMRPDDYLYNKLVEAVGGKRAEEIVNAASVIGKKTFYSSDRRDFLTAIVSGDAARYLDKYEWTSGPLGKVCRDLTEERFYARAKGVTRGLAEEKLRELKAARRQAFAEKNAVVKTLTEEERGLFGLISEFIYLRTYTAENSDRYFYYIRRKILKNIGDRLGLAEDILLLMSPEEVEKAESGFRLSPREIAKRRSGETVVIVGGVSSAYYTGRSYALLRRLLPEASGGKGSVLKGQIACMGEVRAKVRIVHDVAHADDFEEGCILVTTMTVPEITAALDRASGIITDEGGITCHAAIIAREYAVPCLVGTKNATSVLKDGMVVTLDCINGRVLIEE